VDHKALLCFDEESDMMMAICGSNSHCGAPTVFSLGIARRDVRTDTSPRAKNVNRQFCSAGSPV
jgi:hypothetical protein